MNCQQAILKLADIAQNWYLQFIANSCIMGGMKKLRATFDLSENRMTELRKIAARFGCVSKSGPLVGTGSPQPLIDAILDGRLMIVENPNYPNGSTP